MVRSPRGCSGRRKWSSFARVCVVSYGYVRMASIGSSEGGVKYRCQGYHYVRDCGERVSGQRRPSTCMQDDSSGTFVYVNGFAAHCQRFYSRVEVTMTCRSRWGATYRGSRGRQRQSAYAFYPRAALCGASPSGSKASYGYPSQAESRKFFWFYSFVSFARVCPPTSSVVSFVVVFSNFFASHVYLASVKGGGFSVAVVSVLPALYAIGSGVCGLVFFFIPGDGVRRIFYRFLVGSVPCLGSFFLASS